MTHESVLAFVGARPNLPKAATISRAFSLFPISGRQVQLAIVHTGQHSAPLMGLGLARELGLNITAVLNPLKWGSDSGDLAGLILAIGDYMERVERPTLGLVLGDVNSSVAAAMVLARRGIPVVHVEAGLRSGVVEPEELNRRLITAAASFHLAPSPQAAANLHNEGVPQDRVHVVGNTHTEPFLSLNDAVYDGQVLQRLGVEQRGYAIFSAHKPTTITGRNWLYSLLVKLAFRYTILWVLHPHPQARFRKLSPELLHVPGVVYTPPLPYADFACLLRSALFVVTDSAGIQEETTVVGVPCLTIGAPTARPDTIRKGTNRYVGFDVDACLTAIRLITEAPPAFSRPVLWDKNVSRRVSRAIVTIIDRLGDTTSDQGTWVLR